MKRVRSTGFATGATGTAGARAGVCSITRTIGTYRALATRPFTTAHITRNSLYAQSAQVALATETTHQALERASDVKANARVAVGRLKSSDRINACISIFAQIVSVRRF